MDILIINGHNYSHFVERKGYGWSRNDLDSEQTTRLKNGTLRRQKITTKRKLTYKVFRMTREELARLDDDLSVPTVLVKYFDLHGERSSRFYCSSFAVDMEEVDSVGTDYWGGASFTLTEV